MELMKYISWLLVAFFVFCFQEIHFVSGLSIAASQRTIETVYSSVAETSSKNATLQCTFKADPNTTVTWYKESSLLTNQSKFYIQEKTNSSLLTILGVTVNDVGNYSCNATNNQSSAVDHISVSVQVSTSITLNPRSETVIEGYMSLNFTCDANGAPSPTFAWVKNGSLQLQESSKFAFFSAGKILQIKSVTRSDAGNFTCIASNGKSAESSVAVLSVQYIDKPMLNITSNELTLKEKEPLHVKCSSTSLPSAIITWVSDAGAVVSNTDTLLFNSISRNDTGMYFCNATNAAGSKMSVGLNLTVQYLDVPTFNTSSDALTLKEKEPVHVKCSSASLPSASITWVSDAGVVVSNTDTLSFNSISRNDTGRYFCNAINAAVSKTSAGLNITVQYIDVPTMNISSNSLALKENEPLYVKCSSTSLPSASITWVSDAGVVVSNTDTLSFNSIGRNKTGRYFCNATNAAGSKKSAVLTITVQYIDVPTLNISSNELTLKEKESLYVKCQSKSLPSANNTWVTHAGLVVSNTDTLSFNSISRNDTGRYFCNAINAAGSKMSAGLNISVLYIDVPTLNISSNELTLKEKESLHVKCSSTSLPPASITWVSDAGVVVSNTDTLSFNSIIRNNTGRYFCNAANAAGSKMSTGLNIAVQYIDVPTFNISSNELTLKEKESLHVKCSSTSLPSASITWVSDAGVVVSNTDTLSFNSISRNDTGRYFCNATNAAGSKISAGLNITVQYIDVPTLNISSNELTLKEKESLYVKCSSTSLPSASITWVSDAGVVVSKTDTLSLNSISRNDTGMYFCNATNAAGSKMSAGLTITVHYIDKPAYNVTSNQITLIEKDSLFVKCSAVSLPAATYRWISNTGSVISQSDILSFNSITRNETGLYFCNATNSAGFTQSDALHITVHYIDKPTFNASSPVILVEKSSLYVKCSSTLKPAATFKWISSTGHVVSNTDMLMFNSIDRSDAGRYVCNATNAAGSQTASINITVQYIDVPKLNVSGKISLIENSSLSLLCTSTALPAARYEWKSSTGATVSSSAVLSFLSIRRINSGNYSCDAINAAGLRTSSKITVDVQYIDAPTLNSSSDSIVLVEKSSLFINCMVDASPLANYKWISNTGKIVSSRSVLAFTYVGRNDTGSYFCNATNSAGWKSSTTINLNVQYLDVPKLNDSSMAIKEGSSLYVSCSAIASPAAAFQWIFNSSTVVSNSSLLAITSVTRSLKGEYSCKATNQAGITTSKFLFLTVQYLDSPIITPMSPDFIAGSRESVSCSANGYPAPSFAWKTNVKYHIGATGSGNTYEWNPISVAHAGSYSCSASNAFGTKTTSVLVKVKFSPLENTTISTPGTVTRSSATLTLKKFNSIHGPIRYYQVIVRKLSVNVKPVSNTDLLLLLDSFSSASKNTPYITAEFAASVFDTQDTWDFIIGGGQKTNRTKTTARFRRAVQEYYNAPLEPDSYYTAFYRGYVSSTDFISSPWLTPFKTQPKKDTGLTGGQIAGIVIGVILFFALVVFIIYFINGRRKSDHDESEEKMTQSTRKRPSFLTRSLHKAVSDPRTPVAINLFEGHVDSLKANGGFGFSQEYLMISKELLHPYSHSTAPVNSLKNRYANIHSYDHSRVILSRDGSPGSDYINANYIPGFHSSREYIAAQGPLPETINDFWRMVWEQNSNAIVMLTRCMENGRPKCAQYWPSHGSQSCNDLVVSIIEILEFPDHLIRTFHVTKVGQSVERVIKQFHFIGWPDHGVPRDASALFSLLKKVQRWKMDRTALTGPLIVHCSAGVGRTGTYIAVDTQINRVLHSKPINIFENVTELRDQRCWMVQTEDQYAYLHFALVEFIKSGDTEIQAHDLRDYIKKKTDVDVKTGSTGLMDEFVSLAKSDAKHGFQEANKAVNQTKNRYKNVYPYDSTRVKLSNIPGMLGSDYINACYIDGYMQSNAFIATQAPLPGTIADFWRMVWEEDSRTIVMLSNELEAGKVKVNKYWPDEKSVKAWILIVELLNNTDYPEYTLREFKITNSEQGHSRIIRQFQYTAWPENSSPESAFGMIDLIGQVCKWNMSVENKTVTVHCSAGVGRTGLFIALTNLIERLKTEAVVDVYQAVRKLRQQRTAMVQTREQYEFCYRALQEYLDSFDHYANFE